MATRPSHGYLMVGSITFTIDKSKVFLRRTSLEGRIMQHPADTRIEGRLNCSYENKCVTTSARIAILYFHDSFCSIANASFESVNLVKTWKVPFQASHRCVCCLESPTTTPSLSSKKLRPLCHVSLDLPKVQMALNSPTCVIVSCRCASLQAFSWWARVDVATLASFV